MAGKKLNTYVTVHSDDGESITFGPKDKLPKWAREKIENPNVWAEHDDPDEDETPPPPPVTDSSQAGAIPESSTVPPVGEVPLTIPNRGGAGSSSDAWREYAIAAASRAGLNVDIAADANRDDIIEALKSAGIPTE